MIRTRSPKRRYRSRTHSRSPSVVIRPASGIVYSPDSSPDSSQAGLRLSEKPELLQELKEMFGYYDSAFRDKQRNRGELFEKAQKSRQLDFDGSEGLRAMTEGNRRSTFQELQDSCAEQFSDFQTQSENTFTRKQVDRAGGGNLRTRTHEDQQSRFWNIFEKQQEWVRKQYQSADSTWNLMATAAQDQTETLLQVMQDRVAQLIQQQNRKFLASYKGYEVTLGLVVEDMETAYPPSQPTSSGAHPLYHIPSLERRSPERRRRRSRSPPSIRDEMSYGQPVIYPPPMIVEGPSHYEPILMQPAPEMGFNPRTLIPNFSTQKDSDTPNLPQDIAKFAVTTMLQKHQQKFEQLQEDHTQKFQDNMDKQQRTFLINEFTRQKNFKSLLRSSRTDADSQSDQQTKDFEASQQSRDKKFWDAEKERASQFLEDEKGREADFRGDEDTRDSRFYTQQEKFQDEAQDKEKERQKSFVKWEFSTKQRLEDTLEEWQKKLADQALRHEQTFNRMVGLAKRKWGVASN